MRPPVEERVNAEKIRDLFQRVEAVGAPGEVANPLCVQRTIRSDLSGASVSHPRSPNAERSTPGGAYHPAEPYRAPSFIATSLLPKGIGSGEGGRNRWRARPA